MHEQNYWLDSEALLKKIFRFLRRRAVLGLIFGLSLIYCLTSLFWPHNSGLIIGNNDVADIESSLSMRNPNQPFQWHGGPDSNETDEDSMPITCRNSVQGKVLISDDRGYVCQRLDILSNGCCNVKVVNTKLYSCETCQANGCCSIYEYCISCCMQPEKKVLLQKILGQASESFSILFASITDHFELCLAKCRTSSQSVHHENSYRDPKAKHCYGEYPPAVHLSPS